MLAQHAELDFIIFGMNLQFCECHFVWFVFCDFDFVVCDSRDVVCVYLWIIIISPDFQIKSRTDESDLIYLDLKKVVKLVNFIAFNASLGFTTELSNKNGIW